MARLYDAVLFDLLTALLDSWSLWNAVAGSADVGQSWRSAYLRRTYEAGRYRPYEDIVREAAEDVGLPGDYCDDLALRYHELKPWPGVIDALTELRRAGVALGTVTNCSEKLGQVAVSCVGIPFNVVVTAERAGFYKPDPRPYQLALDELGPARDRCLYVAGSAYDLIGTAQLGLPSFWHNRMHLPLPDRTPPPLREEPDLGSLIAMTLE